MIKTKLVVISGLAVVASLFVGVLTTSGTTYAADARNYNAGHIIDDSIFTNSNAMSVQDIQNFLNSKVTCDNWGTKPSELGGGTRAQWLAAHGISTPITCLRDYYENPSSAQNNYGKSIPSGAISAAQIIYNYSQQFHINPQVILVTLQKENGLVTDEWPTPKQYSEAMGFGCPDNVAPGAPACDPNYGSFSAQIYQAARHFRGYIDNGPGWFVPFTTGNNYIAWSPTSSCGGSTVYIDDRSTVALYSYTPYQPNQAAKNAQYGIGDGCSSYGNRNFYMYFTDWFGSTISTVSVSSPLRVTSSTTTGNFTRVPTTVSFDVTNSANYAMGIGSMAVTVRDSHGRNLDYPLKPMLIPAHSTVRYESSQVFSAEETYTFGIVDYNAGVWDENYPASSNSSNPRSVTRSIVAMPTLTSSLSVPDDLRVGKASQITFTVKNNSSQSLNVGKVAAGIRGPSGENLDLAPDSISLSAGQSYVYTKSFTPSREGQYSFSVVSTMNSGATWETNYPLPETDAVQNSFSRIVRPAVTVTSGVQAGASSLKTDQMSQVSFTLKNFSDSTIDLGKIGLSGRDPNGANVDPGIAPVSLAAGETRTISFPFKPMVVGQYEFGIIATQDNGRTWNTGPVSEDGSVSKNFSTSVSPGITLTQGPLLSNALYVGKSTTLSIKLKNYGVDSVDLGKIGLSGRDPNGANVDPGVIPVTLAAGEEKVVSLPFMASKQGTYNFGVISTKDNGRTWQGGPDIDNNNVTKVLLTQAKSDITVISSLGFSVASSHVGEAGTLSFAVRNNSDSTIDLGKIGLSGRDPNGANVDPGVIPVTLAAGETRTISFPFKPMVVGQYSFGVLQTKNNGSTWSTGPDIESGSISNTLKMNPKPSATVISGVTATPGSTTQGGQSTLSFTLKNFSDSTIDLGKIGLSGRDPNGANVDPGVIPVTLAAGEEKVVSFTVNLTVRGAYRFELLGTRDSGRTWNAAPVLESSDQASAVNISVN